MDAMEELSELSESMRQATSLLAADDPSDDAAPRRPSTFLNAVTLGNVGAGKSAVLNSLIGHPVLPTGENGATRAPIVVDLQRDPGLSSKSIVLQIDSKSQQVLCGILCRIGSARVHPVDPVGAEQMRFISSYGRVQELWFFSCEKLQSLPAGLHTLHSLKILKIMECPPVRSLPKNGLPSSVQQIVLHRCNEELEHQCIMLEGITVKIRK